MRQWRQVRGARAALIWGVVAFVAIQLGTTAILEFRAPQLRDPWFGARLAMLHKRLRSARVEGHHRLPPDDPRRGKVVVMLGSSRVAEGLRGAVVEDGLAQVLGRPVVFYNMGFHGDCPMRELLKLERMLAEGVKPDLLLVEILPFYFTDGATEHYQFFPAERLGLCERARLKWGCGFPVDDLKRYTWTCWATPWWAHRVSLFGSLSYATLKLPQDWNYGFDRCGFRSNAWHITKADCQRFLGWAFATYHELLGRYHLGGPFLPGLHEILETCRAHSIPVALVLMPEGPGFQDMYAPTAWGQLQAYLKEQVRPYGTPIINCRNWCAENEFIDSHHLLPAGGAHFTTRLAYEVVLPFLRKAPYPR